jgi:hypothetical protein
VTPAALLLFLLHVGSPDVFFEGAAGPYRLFVTIRPPLVIPGVAEIEIRSASPDLDALHLTPMPLTGLGAKFPPTADRARRSKEDSQYYSGSLWLMTSGSWQVKIQAEGKQGRGDLAVPIPALALRTEKMQRTLGVILAALGLILSAGVVSIIGAAVRESQVEPGQAPSPEALRRARRAMSITAVLVAAILYLGKLWWDSEAGFFERFLYRPLELTATLAPPSRLDLRLRETSRQRFPRPLDQLLPDHGHLVHLFVVRLPNLDQIWHLHPDQTEPGAFTQRLPDLPAGRYQLFADIVFPNGLPETATTEIDLPGVRGTPLTGDDASSDLRAPLTWERDDTPLQAKRATLFRFRLDPPDGWELYMGMPGHAFFLKTDRTVFAHVHPTGSVPMASLELAGADPHAAHQAGLPGVLSFPYGFPEPGNYRIFVQIKRHGRIETAVFDAKVSPQS